MARICGPLFFKWKPKQGSVFLLYTDNSNYFQFGFCFKAGFN